LCLEDACEEAREGQELQGKGAAHTEQGCCGQLLAKYLPSKESLVTYFMPKQLRLPLEKASMLRSTSFLRWLFSSNHLSGAKA
jgi:hypothetical protein